MKKYDVIIIGGGHAGTEAAAIAARAKASVALVTFSKDNIGMLSCNPSIGGLGKGHLVREIDAMDGLMARCADKGGIHFRVLNRSKGAAVQGPRVQLDRDLYKKAVQEEIQKQKNIEIIEAEAKELLIKDKKIIGIKTEKDEIYGKAVVLTTGTFLKGLMHVGESQEKGGRLGEKESNGLSESLKKAGFKLGRLKTGTPARLRAQSINWDACEAQPSDILPEPMSYLTKEIKNDFVTCYLTETTEPTHEMIRKNVERSPLFNGQIGGTGPRYCPSIEDKVVRFPHHKKHTIFLEPEGLDSDLVYPNGLSTSLPKDIQEKTIHDIKGCEKAEIVQYGYAIEYDVIDARVLRPSLESKDIKGLFFAGQINGTSGYEEAGAQGIVAGLNAARYAQEKSPVYFSRTESYIGVLVDDIITLGVDEPYRMFTSRSEYRLYLRSDNADQRLTPLGIKMDVIGEERKKDFEEKKEKFERTKTRLQSTFIASNKSVWNALKQTGVNLSNFENILVDEDVAKQIEIESIYEGYIKREKVDIGKIKKDEEIKIPSDFDYRKLGGLTNEMMEKLERTRPETLANARRISGITPAAIIALMKTLRKRA
ncbi:MAG: tRNA uridine-5-carboxymethylaminomethyl(34) synthesis enzyme MnmG [Alphaproteobacteria bacterium]|nr:tRNA uridine-5-carboxymethylaminomethyl(34) synthesis enzyme MnmG [Alphaproteobacteria bacterium]MBN2779520.1 tRNA uridine-5-carboxymethylaminomethyl(34) synthesis enzyme MnmG [Alphaproteobacteria bacterium]